MDNMSEAKHSPLPAEVLTFEHKPETNPQTMFFTEMAALVTTRQKINGIIGHYRKTSVSGDVWYEYPTGQDREYSQLEPILERSDTELMQNAVRITEQADPDILKSVANDFLRIIKGPDSLYPDFAQLAMPFIPAKRVKGFMLETIRQYETKLADPVAVSYIIETKKGQGILSLLGRVVQAQSSRLNPQKKPV